jgi:hypothetical protein
VDADYDSVQPASRRRLSDPDQCDVFDIGSGDESETSGDAGETVDTQSDISEAQVAAEWSLKLFEVERTLEQSGLSEAAHRAVAAIGGHFSETVPRFDADQQVWIATARAVHVATGRELFQGIGHSIAKRPARRTAYCQVLSYAVCQIAVSLVKSNPTLDWDEDITLSKSHPMLHDRLRDLLQAAARGRVAR